MRETGGWRAAAALTVLILVLAACQTDGDRADADAKPDSPSEAEPAAGQPQPGGVLAFGLPGDPTSLDPAIIRGNRGTLPDAQVAVAIFDALLYEDAETGAVEPLLAESLSSEDGLTWVLSLRDGVRFHDGTTLDAAAVKYNWERMLDEGLSSPHAPVVSAIDSLKVSDPFTLVITLSEPNGQFNRMVAEQLSLIGSPNAIERLGSNFGRQPVGAGPFEFVRWLPDQEIVLKRFDDYWNHPQPFLDRVTFLPIPDREQALAAVVAGELTTMHSSDASLTEQARQYGLQVSYVTLNGGVSFTLNNTKPPFDDIRARQALSFGFDPERHNSVVNDGANEIADTFFRESSQLHTGTRLHTYDPDRAQELFDELAEDMGSPVAFTVTCPNHTPRTCEELQAQMQRFESVEVSVELVDVPTANAGALSGEYQAQLWGLLMVDPEPSFSSSLITGAPLNTANYSDSEVDRLVAAGRASLDPGERRDIYDQIAVVWAEEVPQILTYRNSVFRYSDPALRGIDPIKDNWRWGTLWLER